MIEFNNLVENFNELNLAYMKLTPHEDYNKISRKMDLLFSTMPEGCFIQVKGYESYIHRFITVGYIRGIDVLVARLKNEITDINR